jgi:hypothetical protein
MRMEEVKYAVESRMRTYKYKTGPKINEILEFIRKYDAEEKAAWREEHHANEKLRLNDIHPKVVQVYKSALEEAEEEKRLADENRRKKEKERRKKIQLENNEKQKKLIDSFINPKNAEDGNTVKEADD